MTDTFTRDEEDSALAAEYVLGVLDLAERAAVERRIRTDPVFAGRVTKWEYDFAGMNGGFPEVQAPNLLPQIEARLFGAPETRKADTARTKGAGGWWLRFFGGTAAAGVLAVLVLSTLPPPVPPVPDLPAGPVLTATLAAEGQALILAARYEGETLVVTRTGGEAAPAGQVHQLWLIAEGAPAPVPLGLIETPETRVPLPALPEGAVLAVSLEPAGGSPTGAPTGPVLVTGVVAQVEL